MYTLRDAKGVQFLCVSTENLNKLYSTRNLTTNILSAGSANATRRGEAFLLDYTGLIG